MLDDSLLIPYLWPEQYRAQGQASTPKKYILHSPSL